MTTKQLIVEEIQKVPESALAEVLDFIYFIEQKVSSSPMETAIASEASLKKDWLKSDEDSAWQDL